MPSPITAADHFRLGLQQHQMGQLRQAEQSYKRALSLDPNHLGSLHHLGVLALQAGRPDLSIDLIGRAIALNPRDAECHFNIGLAFGALGRFAEAADHNRRAVELKPDYAEAFMNLGNALKAQGTIEPAIVNYERAIALRPDLAAAHFNLANAYLEHREHARAEQYFREALRLRPGYAEAMTNLGLVLSEQGKADEAEALHRGATAANPQIAQPHVNLGNLFLRSKRYEEAASAYRSALIINANLAEVHANLAGALFELDSKDDALAHAEKAVALDPRLPAALYNLCRALAADGRIRESLEIVRRAHETDETDETRWLFTEYLADPRAIPHADRYRDILIRAIDEGWNSPRSADAKGNLIGTAFASVVSHPAFREAMTAAVAAWPSRSPASSLAGRDQLAAIAADELFRCILGAELIPGAEAEKFLSALRAALLDIAVSDDDGHPALIPLASALARQCFINEYVFYVTEQEQHQVDVLKHRLSGQASRRAAISAFQLAVLAAYSPLHAFANEHHVADAAWPAELATLIQQQVMEPREEREFGRSISALTRIEDAVSRKVRDQYEANPYPRWVKARRQVNDRQTVDAFLRARFPQTYKGGLPASIDYLVAGCGTGAQVAELNSFLRIDRMLAIDLSRASLSYAKRKATELGYDSVDFAQADILQLPSLGRTFDVIDSAGVLVALADPMKGWRSLLSVLRPGGVMRLGLYSELARQYIVLGRQLIAERGLGGTAAEIREFRQEIFQLPADHPLRVVVNSRDFYSTSSCRDLLFHVQEVRFSLPEIAQFLRENNLQFIGFEIDSEILRRYRARFPGDATATDLNLWDRFEQENPESFEQMYQFWVQPV